MTEQPPFGEELAAFLGKWGPYRARLASVLAGLRTPTSIDGLVRSSAVEHRTVRELFAALAADGDLVADGDVVQLRRPLTMTVAGARPDVETLARVVAAAPAVVSDWDHVPATAETLADRAEWLTSTYDMAGARLLCIGDHDLTSVAFTLAQPTAAATVVDIDENLLAYIDGLAARHGLNILTTCADLRLWSPPNATGDLAFTDPPYTAAGVALFAQRAAAGLASHEHGRVAIAYGYSDRKPTLGWQVQRALSDARFVIEALIPGFHHYYGAPALGAKADMYVCRPTPATVKRPLPDDLRIYTHGVNAVESAAPATKWDTPGARAALHGGDVQLSTLFATGVPPALRDKPLSIDLRIDTGFLAIRALLAVNAPEVRMLLPGSFDPAALRIVAAKYRCDVTASHAGQLVVATATEDRTVAGEVLRRGHGKLGKVWAKALADLSGVTKKAAVAEVSEAWHQAGGTSDQLAVRVIDTPRHRIEWFLQAAR